MRRCASLAILVALALGPARAVAALHEQAGASRSTARIAKVAKWVGPVVEAARWGPVTVTVLIRTVKQDGKIVSRRITKVVVDYPDENPRTYTINTDAVPFLISYALGAQGGRIDTVSGATNTSDAFRKSLAGALKRAAFTRV